MGTRAIQYRFTLADKSLEVFNIEFDSKTVESSRVPTRDLPSWTRLDFHKCSHCPLDSYTHRFCPLAAKLVKLVRRFDGLLSYDRTYLEVITQERHISAETTVQRGIGSLIGLVIATSGCPHTTFFKPMARFHLPFAGRDETIYRATSMYLLGQYFLKKQRRKADFTLRGLQQIYRNMQIVNAAIIQRLRSVTQSDSMVNAVLVLDIYAQTVDMMIERSLQNVRGLFTPFFTAQRSRPRR